MLERRRHARSRDFASGTITDGRRRATLDCVVRNMSEGGALLLLDEPRGAPCEVELAIRGGTCSARIVWRGDMAVGVAFAAAGPVPAPRAAAAVVDLAAARRARAGGSDEQRLAERIARFVRRPDLG